MATHILLVEDEASIAEPLAYLLEAEGFTVTTVGDGVQAVRDFERLQPDLVLLDLMLPGLSGTEVCLQIRRDSSVPIIILTAKTAEIDKVVGLELGADDYVTKPYSSRELLARIKALLRRAHTAESTSPASVPVADETEVFEVGNVRLDVGRHAVTIDGEDVELPLKEFELLEVLLRNRGRVLTRGQLISLIWGSDYVDDTRTLDVHIKRLRKRFKNPDDPNRETSRLIRTVRGVGYRID